jgi:Family of unknown function (DUF6152)
VNQRLRLAFPNALLSAVILFAASPTPAHHSFAAYDDARVRTLDGTVGTYQWANPHVLLTVLVKLDDQSEPQEWSIVTASPAILTRFGWLRDSIRAGDRVSVICNPMRDGSSGGRLHTRIMFSTGQILKTKLSAAGDPGPQ